MKALPTNITFTALASVFVLSGCNITITTEEPTTGEKSSFVTTVEEENTTTTAATEDTSGQSTSNSDQTSNTTETAQTVDSTGGSTNVDTTTTTDNSTTDATTTDTTGTTTPVVVNSDPVAKSETVLAKEDEVAIINSLLANDTDADGDALSISSFTQGVNGGVVQQTGPDQFRYTPVADFNGVDTFDYTITDGNGGSATAQVTVNVSPVDDIPSAQADTFTVTQNQSQSIDLTANDSGLGDDAKVVLMGTPSNGSVTVNADGTVSYTPNADYFGSDSFSYRLEDADGDVSIASVSLNITCSTNCDRTFQLSWDASISPNVTNYKVYVGTAPGVYNEVIELGNVRSYNHLVSSKGTYYFAVSSVNDQAIESNLSIEQSAVF